MIKQPAGEIELISENINPDTKVGDIQLKVIDEHGLDKVKNLIEQNSSDKFISFEITSDYVSDNETEYNEGDIIEQRKTHLKIEADGLYVNLDDGGIDIIPWENFGKI